MTVDWFTRRQSSIGWFSPTGTHPLACRVSSSHAQYYTGLLVVLSAEITFLATSTLNYTNSLLSSLGAWPNWIIPTDSAPVSSLLVVGVDGCTAPTYAMGDRIHFSYECSSPMYGTDSLCFSDTPAIGLCFAESFSCYGMMYFLLQTHYQRIAAWQVGRYRS